MEADWPSSADFEPAQLSEYGAAPQTGSVLGRIDQRARARAWRAAAADTALPDYDYAPAPQSADPEYRVPAARRRPVVAAGAGAAVFFADAARAPAAATANPRQLLSDRSADFPLTAPTAAGGRDVNAAPARSAFIASRPTAARARGWLAHFTAG